MARLWTLAMLVLGLLLPVQAQPYRAARVVDPDGTANLRERPDLKSPVLSTVPSGHLVMLIRPQGEFWDVLKLAPIAGMPDSFSYLHRSRLKIVQDGVLGAGCIRDADGWSNLRQGPSNSAKVLTRLTADDWFLILERGEFYRVKTARGLSGYLHQSRVEWLLPRN